MTERIAIVTYNFPPALGGIEQYCAQLARALHGLNVQVQVIAKAQPRAARFDAAQPYGVRRYRGADLGLVAQAEPLIEGGYDCFLCMQWTSALTLSARRALTGRPRTLGVVAHGKELHPSDRSVLPGPLYLHALRGVLERANRVLAVSTFTAELARRRAPRAEVCVVSPGVDAERLRPPPAATSARFRVHGPGPYLLSVSRLIARKGIDTVLRALPELARGAPQLRYLIAGEGPDRARLQALARELGVHERVVFLGRVDDAQLCALYGAADFFVLLSRTEGAGNDVEGFGLVLLEAQAAGTPVVASRAGGMPDALVPEVTGLLVEPGDPGDFARRLAPLLHDATRRRTMSQAARAHACARSWSDTAQRTLQVLGSA